MLVLLGVASAAGLAGWALRGVGHYLVVTDRLQPGDAILVLSGRTPVRELEAASLYRRGLAPRILVSRIRVGSEFAYQDRQARILRHAGVPGPAIVPLTRRAGNTRAELQVAFDHAEERGYRRLILVTSAQHTRRVRLIWNLEHERRLPALVHPSSYEPFDPDGWWQTPRDRRWGLHELAGIAGILLVSPLADLDPAR